MKEQKMVEQAQQPETIKADEGFVSDAQGASDVVENTTGDRGGEKEKKKVVGNNPKGINQYTGKDFAGASYKDTRTMMKIYYEFHPEMQERFVEKMAEKAAEDPQWAKLVIQMTGGFDPTETKISGELTQVAESPLNGLTIDELKSLKALKQKANEEQND